MTVAIQEIYEMSNQLTFIISDGKVIVKTPYQTNLVTYAAGNYRRRLERLEGKIRAGQIKTITQLIEYNKPRISGAQIQGLILVPTRLERHVK